MFLFVCFENPETAKKEKILKSITGFAHLAFLCFLVKEQYLT